jgi:NAD(P)-dependent dehydrogenase (short-subunit alcohol dehydrogenase family)
MDHPVTANPEPAPPAPTYPDLRDQPVLVTGGAAGIGAAICAAFLRQGSQVICLDRDQQAQERLQQQWAEAPGRLHGYTVDLCDSDALVQTLEQVKQAFPGLRIVIANAGYDPRHDGLTLSEQEWNALFQLNVTHYFITCRELMPHLIGNGGGSVILTASHTAWLAKPDLIAYNSTKAAILGLCRSLAEAYGRHRIRVNAVAPGWTMTERQLRQWVTSAAIEDTVQHQQAIPILITPEQVAELYLFLASEASQLLTRQVLIADAGQTKI